MAEILNFENIGTLFMLIFLQAVLGFDNLLYISIESKRVEPDKAAFVRRTGIGLAIIFRIVLLFVVLMTFSSFQSNHFDVDLFGLFSAKFTVESIIVLLGGIFIVYTALKEIMHMLSIDELENNVEKQNSSTGKVIFAIVVMNLVFSFDSILSAIALTDVTWVIVVAIVLSGLMMIFLADTVSTFLQKNRLYEVLGLFILFVVGIMLISEGGHKAHLSLMGHPVEAMSKSTFYFVIIILVLVDVAQSRYQKKLDLERKKDNNVAS